MATGVLGVLQKVKLRRSKLSDEGATRQATRFNRLIRHAAMSAVWNCQASSQTVLIEETSIILHQRSDDLLAANTYLGPLAFRPFPNN